MAYEYEDKINDAFFKASRGGRNVNKELLKELQEVYSKAKAFDEINKILDVYLGNVEDELNALNLIREKLEDMEDE